MSDLIDRRMFILSFIAFLNKWLIDFLSVTYEKKVQVGKDQEKAQSEKDSHSKNQGGKKQTNNQVLIP